MSAKKYLEFTLDAVVNDRETSYKRLLEENFLQQWRSKNMTLTLWGQDCTMGLWNI